VRSWAFVAALSAAALMTAPALGQGSSKDDKIITVLIMQRPCKLWLNEARLKSLRTEMVESQRGGDMDAKMFSAMHDEAVAATFTIIGDFIAKSNTEASTCEMATNYAKELKLMK